MGGGHHTLSESEASFVGASHFRGAAVNGSTEPREESFTGFPPKALVISLHG